MDAPVTINLPSISAPSAPTITAPVLNINQVGANDTKLLDPEFDDLTVYETPENGAQKASNDLVDVLRKTGIDQLVGLKGVVERTVHDGEYRSQLASDQHVIENLIYVLKQSITNIDPVFDQLAMPIDIHRQDFGGTDESHGKRLYLVKWAVVIRVLNILKNLLVSRQNIQDDIYEHRLLLTLVKNLPKLLVAKEIAIQKYRELVGPSDAEWLSRDITRKHLLEAIPICAKADVTLSTFLLNSIAGSSKMQDFIRPQLWSGPLALLSLSLTCTRNYKGEVSTRYVKDLSHFITLFHTLFLNVSEAELSDWWELEQSSRWTPQGEVNFNRVAQNNKKKSELQRTATSLSTQLSIPTVMGGFNNEEQNPGRVNGCFGAVMEPQSSCVEGKGVHIDRLKSFKMLADKSEGGSLGLSGREALCLIFSAIDSGLNFVEKQNPTDYARDAHDSWRILLTKMGRRGGINFWHAYYKTMNRCKPIKRIIKAIQYTKDGAVKRTDDDKFNDQTMHYMMCEAMLSKISVLLEEINYKPAGELVVTRIDDILMFESEDMSRALNRYCVGEIMVKKIIMYHVAKGTKTKDIEEFLMGMTEMSGGQEVPFIGQMVEAATEYEAWRIELFMRESIEATSITSLQQFTDLEDFVKEMAEGCDPQSTDTATHVSAGVALRLVEQCHGIMEASELKMVYLEKALRQIDFWVKFMQQFMVLEQLADTSSKKREPEAETMMDEMTKMRTYIRDVCNMSMTLCLEALTNILVVSVKTEQEKKVCFDFLKSTQIVSEVAWCQSVHSEDEPTLRERAHLLLVSIRDICGDEE